MGICIKRVLGCEKCVYTRNGDIREERDNFWEELKGCIEACDDKGIGLVIRDVSNLVRMEKL